ncbi:xanthine phosphoribosyltransferase [bacterium 210820-DFI.6.37]|nr:xanthine phosphoribosyltransferase [bacterium 210820-DFI.6.37]
MKALKEKILTEGQAIGTGIVKVDGFLNHQIDVSFMDELGKEFGRRFQDERIDKILTVEASGIAIACMTAPYFGYPPVVFAKKTAPNTMTEEFYGAEARSFTKGTVSIIRVSKKYLKESDRVLILDDFLAHGEASMALTQLVKQAGGTVVGIGAVIEKGFQGGGQKLREAGYRLESLAIIERIENGIIQFA